MLAASGVGTDTMKYVSAVIYVPAHTVVRSNSAMMIKQESPVGGSGEVGSGEIHIEPWGSGEEDTVM